MKTELSVNELVTQNIRIINRTEQTVNNAIAVISIPQGFRAEESSLATLRYDGLIEKYETNYDSINLYLRDVRQGEIKDLSIDYRPGYPAKITAGQIKAYDYYNPGIEGIQKPFIITVE